MSAAAEMAAVLADIVVLFDDGLINDRIVKRADGVQVWLIDELARELVRRHFQQTGEQS